MTAVPHASRETSRQRGLKGLAGALFFVCTVLVLLAFEQRHAVEAWRAIRDGAIPAGARVVGWVRDGAGDGLSGLRTAVADGGPAAAAPGDVLLAGEFAPADEATRGATGGAAFAGATIRFESGETLRTRPLRIAAGREAFVTGQTFAGRFAASDDAQIEVRQVIAPDGDRAVAPSALCGGRTPGAVVLLHRRTHVDMVLFRERTIIGDNAPAEAICGVWRYRKR